MKREIRYKSPKEYQEKNHNENSNPSKLPKPKSKYCKFLKGPHQYGEWSNLRFPWNPKKQSILWKRFCIRCNRKETWLSPSKKGSLWYEVDYDARPPGYVEKQPS